jgi:hypothetical protein
METEFLKLLLTWFVEQRGWIAFSVAAAVIVATFVLWFGFSVFWPWGFVMGTVLALLGIVFGK